MQRNTFPETLSYFKKKSNFDRMKVKQEQTIQIATACISIQRHYIAKKPESSIQVYILQNTTQHESYQTVIEQYVFVVFIYCSNLYHLFIYRYDYVDFHNRNTLFLPFNYQV